MDDLNLVKLANSSTSLVTRLGWVSEPSERGTLAILVSCLSTLFLCTWSVMHLNIPPKRRSMLAELRTHCKWCLIGVLGPELAIWIAWKQYLSAKALRDEVESRAAQHKLSATSLTATREPWTLTHGFYAAMGGFVVDLDDGLVDEHPRFTEKINRLTFTPKGIALLAKCGHPPRISRGEILDKSKIDGLGKSFACIQALWMTTQVCTRLIAGLPVTLLEVMTLGHVLCALVLYMMWWHKPRWVQEPTRLEGEWVRPICAFMFMASDVSIQRDVDSDFSQRFKLGSSEISDLAYFPSITGEDAAPPTDVFRENQIGAFVPRRILSACLVTSNPCNTDLEDSATHSTMQTNEISRTRRLLASEAIDRYLAIRKLFSFPTTQAARKYNHALKMYPEMPLRFRKEPVGNWTLSSQWQECGTEHLVCTEVSNWPSDGLLSAAGGLLMGTVLWFSSIGFSAVHIAAWHATFPSPRW